MLDPRDRLREVRGEAIEIVGRLGEPEHEHERRLRGELDVDVVGGAAEFGFRMGGRHMPGCAD